LSTYNELSFLVNCDGSKYDYAWLGLRVAEGSTFQLLKEEYCSFIRLVSSLLKYMGLGGADALDIVVSR